MPVRMQPSASEVICHDRSRTISSYGGSWIRHARGRGLDGLPVHSFAFEGTKQTYRWTQGRHSPQSGQNRHDLCRKAKAGDVAKIELARRHWLGSPGIRKVPPKDAW